MRVLCCTLIPLPLTLVAQLNFTTFNTGNSGLHSNTVRDVAIDHAGVLWIATDFGLSTYDGVVWNVFDTSNSDLPDDQVRSLFVESDSVLWVGTLSGGATRIDPGNWTTFNTANSPLPNDFVRAITLDRQGFYWFATAGGLANFDGVSWDVYDQFNSVLGSNNITSMLVAIDSSLWVGTVNGGLTRIQDSTWTTFKTTNSQIPDNTILTLGQDTFGRVWMGTAANGLVVYDGNQFISFNTGNSGLPSNTVTDLALDSSQHLWLTTPDAGLVVFGGLAFSSWNSANSALPENDLLAVELGPEAWLGTQSSGLIRVTLGLGVPVGQMAITVFPNPCTEQFLRISGCHNRERIQVIDMSGNLRLAAVCEGSGYFTLDVDLLGPGAYFLRVYEGSNRGHYALIIKP
jgi:ligand-binding sensor domain-containing protein